jgi:hypothetical protein
VRVFHLILPLLMLFGCSGKVPQETVLTPLSEAEVTQALKDALSRSIVLSAASAGRTDAYFANPQLKIELPEDADKLQNTLRKLGFAAEIDRSVLQLNRAAERAAASAKPVFIKAITSLSIDDPFELLNGGPDAATSYLIDESRDELHEQFRPIVSEALTETSATRYYAAIVEHYNGLPLVYDVDPDLEDYATEQALDGLFLLMAQEEARIRTLASSRSTRLIKRVFGSLDQVSLDE